MIIKDKIKETFDKQGLKAQELRAEKTEKRFQRLKKLRKWIYDHREKICEAVYSDFKKPYAETDVTEIAPCILELNHAMKYLAQWTDIEPVKNHISYLGASGYVQYEPKGVCLIISPWNYPFSLAIGPLVSAIAAGNTVMMKPSELTPHTSALLREMLDSLFAPDEVCVFEGGVEVSQALLQLPFNHIFFTGSPKVGKIVMEAAAKNLSSVTLELGGKSPVIVDESASIRDAARRIAWGKLVNNGQTCVAPDYLLVHENKRDQLLTELKKQMSEQFGEGNEAYQTSDSYARIVNQGHYERLTGLIEDAIKKGASVNYGNQTDESEKFIAPTIIENYPKDAAIDEEEIFGPLLTIDTFKDLDEVITMVNGKPKPLSMYIFSKKKKHINRLIREISAGSVAINETLLQFAHPYLPFGGVNNSGIGKAHGKYGFEEFSNIKSILKQKNGITSASVLMPPYPKAKKFVDLFMNTILKWKL